MRSKTGENAFYYSIFKVRTSSDSLSPPKKMFKNYMCYFIGSKNR
jgi:hypothetical protein